MERESEHSKMYACIPSNQQNRKILFTKITHRDTGERKTRPEWITLTEEFFSGQEAFVDVKVKVLYDGEKGDILNQYVRFTKVYNEQVKLYGRTRKAVLETIHICKDEDVLAEYLKDREKEVVDIMMTLFEQEYAVERYGDEKRAEGKAEGRTEGELNKAKEMAFSLFQMGVPIEKIAEAAKLDVGLVRNWLIESGTVGVKNK